MRFLLVIFALLFIFSNIIPAQEPPRPQQIEELKKLTAQLERVQEQIRKIEAQRDEIGVELIAVTESDREEAARSGAKAVRLFPDGLMDNLIYAPDEIGFSVYSFTEVADYYLAPRIEYKNNALEFYKDEEKNLGFIAAIGKTAIETINEQSREVLALGKFQPPSDFKTAKSEYLSGSQTFGKKAAVTIGDTYLARVIHYGSGDAIFALKIHRRDTDESIILLVKKIKTFDPPPLLKDDSAAPSQKPTNQSVAADSETVEKIRVALLQKGFADVTVDGSTTPVTLRGTVPKGKLAEAIQTAQEAGGGKPIRNEITEQ